MDAILRLPAPVRHSILAVSGILITWLETEFVPGLENQSNLAGSILAAVTLAVLGVITPLINSYGVGAARARELQASTGNIV